MESQNKRGNVVFVAAVAINFFCGLGYIWSIIAKQLIAQLHWTSFQASMPFTVFSLMFAFSMLVLGPVQDKKGPRFIATMGSLLIGGGLFLTGIALTPTLIILTFGGMTGFGLGSMYAATVPPALKWFPAAKRGTINGTIVAALALASIMYSPITNYLMVSVGIAPTFWIIGGALLLLLPALSQLIRNPPAELAFPGKAGSGAGTGAETAPGQMLRTASFYKIWLMFAFSASSSLMIVSNAATIAKVQAHWSGGYLLVILLALCNGGGRFLGGFLSDKLGKSRLMILTFVIQVANILIFNAYRSPLLLAIGVAVAGLCYGSTMVVFSATTAGRFGMKNFGANYGIVYTAWGLAGVVGPLPTAIILDRTGSYQAAYILSAVLVLVAFGLALSYHFRDEAASKPVSAKA